MIKKSGMSDSEVNKVINEEIDKVRTSSENQTTFQKDPKIDKNKIIDDVEKVKNLINL